MSEFLLLDSINIGKDLENYKKKCIEPRHAAKLKKSLVNMKITPFNLSYIVIEIKVTVKH